MTLNLTALGKRVKAVRKKRGLSQNRLSEILHISPTYISHLENGSKSMSLELFVSLVNALDTTAEELLCDNLENSLCNYPNRFSFLLEECSEFEQRFLFELMEAAKQAIRNNIKYLEQRW